MKSNLTIYQIKKTSLFMRVTKVLILSATLFLIVSCEIFKSDTPISNPINSKILDDFSGEWIMIDQNDTFLHPLVNIKLIPYNENEYVSTVLYFSNRGRNIKLVETYKVFISNMSGDIYFNVKELSLNNSSYFFVKVDELNKYQVSVQYLLDSFSNEINELIGLRENLKNKKIKETYFSSKFMVQSESIWLRNTCVRTLSSKDGSVTCTICGIARSRISV